MVDLLLSAAHGVLECQLGLVHLERRIQSEALSLKVQVQRLQAEPSPHGFHSLQLRLTGDAAEELAARWLGTVQWQWASGLRPGHRRKNWFLGVFRLENGPAPPAADLRFSSCRASGKGGQHVNKTNSAVWAEDRASGLRVKVQAERSQGRNRATARRLIEEKRAELAAQQRAAQARHQQRAHWQVQRGAPVRVFAGPDFQEVNS